jgi:hypothetical protein
MRLFLAACLVLCVFLGGFVFNSNDRIFDLPAFFVWTVFSVLFMAAGMWLIFILDPKNSRRK